MPVTRENTVNYNRARDNQRNTTIARHFYDISNINRILYFILQQENVKKSRLHEVAIRSALKNRAAEFTRYYLCSQRIVYLCILWQFYYLLL